MWMASLPPVGGDCAETSHKPLQVKVSASSVVVLCGVVFLFCCEGCAVTASEAS